MRVQFDLTLGGDPKRSVHAMLDADPRTHLRDLLPLLHESLQQVLYEDSKPGEPLGDALRRTRVPSRTKRVVEEHVFELVFQDEHGDLYRCSCGDQGWDFAQGREAYARHLTSLTEGPDEEYFCTVCVKVVTRCEHLPNGLPARVETV